MNDPPKFFCFSKNVHNFLKNCPLSILAWLWPFPCLVAPILLCVWIKNKFPNHTANLQEQLNFRCRVGVNSVSACQTHYYVSCLKSVNISVITKFSSLQMFNPTSYGILESRYLMGVGPKISRKELSLTPCCYIAFVCLYIYMQKFGPKSQNWSEISGFENFVKLRFRITLTSEKWL